MAISPPQQAWRLGAGAGWGLTYQPSLSRVSYWRGLEWALQILLRVFLDRETWPREGCPQSGAGRGQGSGAPLPCTNVNETSPGLLVYLWGDGGQGPA